MYVEDLYLPKAYAIKALNKWPASQEPTETGYSLAFNTTDPFFVEMAKDPVRLKRLQIGMSLMNGSEGFDVSHFVDNYPWDTPQRTVPFLQVYRKGCLSLSRSERRKKYRIQQRNSKSAASTQSPRASRWLLKGNLRKDPNLFAESFDLHAVLEDEATTHNGRAAIKARGADALIAHNTTVSVQKVTRNNDDKLFLEVIMDGDFKESYGITEPFTLYMTFAANPSSVI